MFGTYNRKIERAVKANWTLTEYEFLELKDLKKKMKDPNASFLVRTKIVFDKDKTNTSYTFLSLMLGSRTASNVSKMPDLCSFPLSYYNVDYDKYDYKLGSIVKFMQNHMELTK